MNALTQFKMNYNSTHPDNKTLMYPWHLGPSGTEAAPYKPSCESRTGVIPIS